MKRLFAPVATTFLAGLLAVLPLVLTIAVVIWLRNLAYSFLGPSSLAGGLLKRVGLTFATERLSAYLVGAFFAIAGIYLMGMLVQSRLSDPLRWWAEERLRRLPLIGQVYEMSSRLVGVFDRRGESDMKGMNPVWCIFGGGDGAAVLALLPNPQPVKIDGRDYVGVLIPTAPVPFGGALLYVPADWVKPADIGVETLTSVYVTMGATPPTTEHSIHRHG
jgi:uncharacterized membrane protein